MYPPLSNVVPSSNGKTSVSGTDYVGSTPTGIANLPDNAEIHDTTFLERAFLIPNQIKRLYALPFGKGIGWFRVCRLVIWGVFHGMPFKVVIPPK